MLLIIYYLLLFFFLVFGTASRAPHAGDNGLVFRDQEVISLSPEDDLTWISLRGVFDGQRLPS